MLQQQQRSNRRGAMAPSATRNSKARGPTTSEGSGESSWMEGGAGDSTSWDDLVARAKAGPGASKRKKTNAGQPTSHRPFPLTSEEAREEAIGTIHEHAKGLEPSQRNIVSRAISASYPDFSSAAVNGVASQVLCMIPEYHLACATRGSTTMSPILPEAVESYLPPLEKYARPSGTGLTDVRVRDHKSHSLRIAVWLHRMDMCLSGESEASESLVLSRHVRGPLLSYLLAPRTGNLRFEEVATQVVDENWEAHERAKGRLRTSLHNNCRRWAKLLKELDDLSKGFKATRKPHKETEIRIGVLHSTLRKVETLISESEDHLEESWIREEEARSVDQDQSDSNTDDDRDVVVEGEQDTGPISAEAPDPPTPTASAPEAEHAMEVEVSGMPQLTSEDTTPVMPEEDAMLMGDPISVTGEMAQLQVTPPKSHESEDGEAS